MLRSSAAARSIQIAACRLQQAPAASADGERPRRRRSASGVLHPLDGALRASEIADPDRGLDEIACVPRAQRMLDPELFIQLRCSQQLQVGLGDVAHGERHEPEDVPVQGRHDEVTGLARKLQAALRQFARLVHPALERVDQRETA